MSIDLNRVAVAVAGLLLVVTAVATGSSASQAAVGDDVRLNEIQVVGSHNSYKVLPSEAEQDLIRSVIGDGADLMQYEHAPLPEQFSDQRVRQIELDVWVDEAGGLYSQPLLRTATGQGPYRPELMDQPGIKTFHIQDVDYGSTCPTFVLCLQQVKAWSDANAGHVPLAILVELKDTPLVVGSFEFTDPEPWTAAGLDSLDAEIRSVFSDEDLITPDDVRGGASTLREAVTTTGWPTLGQSRGKVMFLMDNGGGMRTSYLAGHPSLAGRVLFTNAPPAADDAAFVKRNDPFDPSIPGLVADGFVVRTRADSDTEQARSNDTTMRDAALASGAQWVSTDYPVPGLAVGFTTEYWVGIPGGTVARCNPVNAPASCVDAELDQVGAPAPQPQPPAPSVPPFSPDPTGSTPSTGPATTEPGAGSTTQPPPGGPSTTEPSPTGPPTTSPSERPPTRPTRPAPRPPAAAPVRAEPSYTG